MKIAKKLKHHNLISINNCYSFKYEDLFHGKVYISLIVMELAEETLKDKIE